MDPMKNHEGYHDPTAGRAIRNAARKERRERGRMPSTSPTAWERSEHSGSVQSVCRDTEMILKICAKQIKS